MNPLKSFLFPVPGYRGGEHGNRGTRNTFPSTNFGSTRVPGTFREHSGTRMTKRKPYRVQARPAQWDNADGTSSDLVKLYGGNRGSIALDYSEIPRLIAELATLLDKQPSRKEQEQ